MNLIVFGAPVVPLAMPSLPSGLAVLCHRIWENGRSGTGFAQGVIRALHKVRAILDLDAIS